MKKEVAIREATSEDIQDILNLIALSPDALLSVTIAELQSWIDLGMSLVAINEDGEIIGHQAAAQWPESHWVEMRAAIVKEDYRGQGINTLMKHKMTEIIAALIGNATLIGFTEKASGSRGILQKQGYDEIPLPDTPEEFFSVCPAYCYRKTGEDCGCAVYIKHLNNESEKR